jgi:hypothetical protein
MNRKCIGPCALLFACLCAPVVHAEYPKAGASDTVPQVVEPSPFPPAPSEPMTISTSGLSSWITYRRPCCEGPIGGDGPITYELYLQSGPTFPIGGGFFGHTLEDGWEIQGGGRTFFFNTDRDAAWTVDVSGSNMHNQGQHSDMFATLHNIIVPPGIRATSVQVTTRDLNRTFFNLGGGREWFLGAPDGDSPTWRFGVDAGWRYGSAKLKLHEIQHRTEEIEGTWVSAHADVEIPCGCISFVGGVRLEWDYTWMHHILQSTDTNLQDINLLFTAGIRF